MPQGQVRGEMKLAGAGLASVRVKVNTAFAAQLATATVAPRMAMPVAAAPPGSVTVLAATGDAAVSAAGVYMRIASWNVAQRFPSASNAIATALAANPARLSRTTSSVSE